MTHTLTEFINCPNIVYIGTKTPFPCIFFGRIHNGKAYEDRWSGKLYKIDLETGEKTIACEPWKENYGGRPAGAATDKDGTIWIADLRLGLYKYTPKTGECAQQATVDTDGNPLQGLVDLMFDHDGNLWINGPATPLAPTPENFVRVQEEKMGVLYYLPRGATKLTRIQNATFQFNNGIAVRGNLLLQVESFGEGITAWDIVGPGKLENRRVWATMPESEAEEGWSVGPDGLDIDAAGNVLVAHSGASFIEVYSPGAKLIGRIKCPFRRPSNLQFAPGSCACYVTDHDTHAVYKFDWLCHGWPTYGE